MKLATTGASAVEFSGGLLVVGRFADGEPSAAEQAIDAALGGALGAAAKRLRFAGKARQKVALDTLGQLPATRVMLLGLGDAAELGAAGVRDYAALAIEDALGARLDTVGVVVPRDDAATAEQVALGGILGAYRWVAHKAEPEDGPRAEIESLTLIGAPDAGGAIARAETLAGGVTLARTLTNEPAHVCNPERLADVARSFTAQPGVTATIFGKEEIYRRGMGGVIGVSRGAKTEPRVIHVSYVPDGHDGSGAIALVGKGITFDSGGLSIKPAKGMVDMYIDMGGAAAVLGAMKLVCELQPGVPVHAVVGACENMTGADAYRPSDILSMYSGKTVEVLNTDAEGRLVLADCLHYVTELEPPVRGVVNAATLTGSCMVALGNFYGGVFSDHDGFCAELLAAADVADERFWRLPLDPKLAKGLESRRADIKNVAGPYGGAITAAQFLQNFKGDLPWVHLDVAGAVLADKDDGHIRAGGTGFGVLTLFALIEAAAAQN